MRFSRTPSGEGPACGKARKSVVSPSIAGTRQTSQKPPWNKAFLHSKYLDCVNLQNRASDCRAVWLIRGRAAKAEGQNAQTQCVRGHISAKGREAMRSSAIMLLCD